MANQMVADPAQAGDPQAQLAEAVTEALLRALQANAQASLMAGESAGEAKDFADACLKLAQAIVVLDPNLAQDGTPLDHQLALEQARATGQVAVEAQRGQNALEQAKQAAAAPTPARSVGP